MKLDLTNAELFREPDLNLYKDINFIFGKNGSGKSTITKLIKEQSNCNYDMSIFQGFKSVLGEDKKLNAVILGKENIEINKQIKLKEMDKASLESEINLLQGGIKEPIDEHTENLFVKLKIAEKAKNDKLKQINSFYTKSATAISEDLQIVENARKYNKNIFEKEIEKGEHLEKGEIEKYKKILNSERKLVTSIDFPIINPEKYLQSVNEVLEAKVESKIIIEELQGNSGKANFAQEGLNIHNIEDMCAFCGNKVSEDRIVALKSYFSADDVEALKTRIVDGKKIISDKKNLFQEIKINPEEFYPDYIEDVNELNKATSIVKEAQLIFFEKLEQALEEKEKHLFEITKILALEIPASFEECAVEYKKLSKENNEFSINLSSNQKSARDSLRYHKVKKLADSFNIESNKAELKLLIENKLGIQKSIDGEKEKIDSLIQERNKISIGISELLKNTKDTKKLAENINSKLKNTVTFRLHRKKEDDQEFYEIESMNGQIRPITELSTGEKNIIAFLYFIEKLDEVIEISNRKPKLIIFDDPMNSNDDTMQYLITDELQKLMKKCQKSDSSQKFILLTHNIFFYLNCSFESKNRRDDKNPFEENNYYKLLCDGNQTKIIKINNRQQDFKTNYEALWHELIFLYDEDKPEMMLNPIRRIIETYVVFNGKEDFYKDNKHAKNLFNTNSHYFPDLEADLNGKTRNQIKNIMKDCFKSNDAENHFNKHWKNASKINTQSIN